VRGRLKAKRISNRKFVGFGLLVAVLLVDCGLAVVYWKHRKTEFEPRPSQAIPAEALSIPDDVLKNVPAPSWDGDFPCVYAVASVEAAPKIGSCATPAPMSNASRQPVDRFETDLRRGNFILRQSDLVISGAGLAMPLTRSYNSQGWMPQNKNHAFGLNANHPYDIAPLGTHFPYTEQYIVLENGDFLYFSRVSAGSGYSDAIFLHSETGTSFYKATTQWNGDGWLTRLQDGSTIRFPDSYKSKSLAQGAAVEMVDGAGNKIELVRDSKRNLREIQGPAGTFIKLEYDGGDRIVRAADDRGEWASYRYDAAGHLTDVAHSTGGSRYYYYEDGLLTWARDEKGRVLVHNSYHGGWVVEQTFGNGQTIGYHYDLAKNGKYAERVRVRLPDGSMQTVETAGSVSYVYKRMK
jgi:YD repeat-containing protein